MTEGRLKTINIAVAEKSAGCFDRIDLVSSLPPLKSGDKPKLCDKLVVKNAGTATGYISAAIYESTSARTCITPLWTNTTYLAPNEKHDFGSIIPSAGVTKDYPPGSILYLCFKAWSSEEELWTCCPEKPCSTAAVKLQWA